MHHRALADSPGRSAGARELSARKKSLLGFVLLIATGLSKSYLVLCKQAFIPVAQDKSSPSESRLYLSPSYTEQRSSFAGRAETLHHGALH